jgi:hypothetical protein
MAVEDFEYYAIYESNYFDLLISFMMFKPIEYLCEVAAEFISVQGRSLSLRMPSMRRAEILSRDD